MRVSYVNIAPEPQRLGQEKSVNEAACNYVLNLLSYKWPPGPGVCACAAFSTWDNHISAMNVAWWWAHDMHVQRAGTWGNWRGLLVLEHSSPNTTIVKFYICISIYIIYMARTCTCICYAIECID